ncbi:uncharacterized protein LOC133017495 [Limanda limanda]|uniref:uncharacterized protein LOC133017495 n=1 Tax=Limanda limanda TaxID=27771 RepID=UPI0029C9880C|nr:uncharacterized protein LOC133017495 [Limanda limanda]
MAPSPNHYCIDPGSKCALSVHIQDILTSSLDKNGSVCIVYDDSKAPNPVMRAVFQSDGRAACYHSNGNIWLSLNTSGGQCLDEAGARVSRWRWEGPLHPVFLSLNKSVGVRVFGRKQVFVSFLAQGQQAKFSVGACCAQDGAEFLQKYYSSGKKCLTLFSGGSAQVFYPSGHLALVVVTEENGSVCIVYDDIKAPNPVMRAVFQSDGRAACYHSNGNIWLSLNTSGGQCLDEAGARVCRWRWEGPLHPVFLSLNKSVGVRVLGRKQVFVSFLAQGQHAKFSVGVCCAQVTHLHVVAQRLLTVSAHVIMSDNERAFIHKCLQGCL